MNPQPFSIPTEDHVAELCGGLTIPDGLSKPTGALLIVPGGWFTERDGFFGDSYTEADLMYLRLGRRIASQGYIVARYDNRGVSGNEFTIGLQKDSYDPTADSEHYLQTCVNSQVRRSVTPESLTCDVKTVYRHIAEHAAVDPRNVVIFAHSEGGLHVARSIGDARINPKGIVFAGVITESPQAILRWQMIDKYVDEVMRWDSDNDGQVSSLDVRTNIGSSFFSEVGISATDLQPQTDAWTENELRDFFESRYEREKHLAMSISDEMPYPLSNDEPFRFVAASHRWWKQWFVNGTTTMELLRDFDGPITYHFGEIDSQLLASRQIEYLKKRADKMKRPPNYVLHELCGHAFGKSKPANGPMAKESEDILCDDIVGMLQEMQDDHDSTTAS